MRPEVEHIRGSKVHQQVFGHRQGRRTVGQVRTDHEVTRAASVFYTDHHSGRGKETVDG